MLGRHCRAQRVVTGWQRHRIVADRMDLTRKGANGIAGFMRWPEPIEKDAVPPGGRYGIFDAKRVGFRQRLRHVARQLRRFQKILRQFQNILRRFPQIPRHFFQIPRHFFMQAWCGVGNPLLCLQVGAESYGVHGLYECGSLRSPADGSLARLLHDRDVRDALHAA